ncbi:MAG: N-substituted formamide deformylase [Anaerolineales bacterium]|nr:N-substituted formamide deformylase [Anaerolineales bacterium]
MTTQADLILQNTQIYTVDPGRPWAEAVACAGGQILAVGSGNDLMDLAGPDTQVIDAGGRLALPGFTDAHVHLLQVAIRSQEVSLFGVRDFDEARRRVRDAVAEAEPGEWLKGWGWDENFWDVQPTRQHLDDIAPNTPIALARTDMHSWWVNSAALRKAGITRETPDPPESRIERDAEGEPTGILREWNAIRLIEQHIPDPAEATLQQWLRDAIAEAHRLGLTGAHDMRTEAEGRTSFRLFQALRHRGELDLRVHMNIAEAYVSEADTLGLRPGFGDDRLWIGHVKAFADGSMGSRTALMLEPYEGEPDNRGVAVTSADELWELAVQADEAGFPLSIHAIGDLAVRNILDVLSEFQSAKSDAPASSPNEFGACYEKRVETRSGRVSAMPHRIEHVQVLHPDDLGRLSRYNIVASMQPVHLQGEWDTTNRTWGQRARYAYALRSLLDQGTRLALGSDAPVAPLNPMLGIHAAVTRQDLDGEPEAGWHPEERITVSEAIHGYTMGPAYAAGKQHVQGSIAPGKWADIIVLDRNIFEIPPAEIAGAGVDLMIFDGRVVHQR